MFLYFRICSSLKTPGLWQTSISHFESTDCCRSKRSGTFVTTKPPTGSYRVAVRATEEVAVVVRAAVAQPVSPAVTAVTLAFVPMVAIPAGLVATMRSDFCQTSRLGILGMMSQQFQTIPIFSRIVNTM